MPEWEDLIQDEKLSGLEALLEYDREDKLQAERESKIKIKISQAQAML